MDASRPRMPRRGATGPGGALPKPVPVQEDATHDSMTAHDCDYAFCPVVPGHHEAVGANPPGSQVLPGVTVLDIRLRQGRFIYVKDSFVNADVLSRQCHD